MKEPVIRTFDGWNEVVIGAEHYITRDQLEALAADTRIRFGLMGSGWPPVSVDEALTSLGSEELLLGGNTRYSLGYREGDDEGGESLG